ncbi:hypothetical protein [Frankia nepalensis]|nr:hypothetical protein [Frankia nepalensis]
MVALVAVTATLRAAVVPAAPAGSVTGPAPRARRPAASALGIG